LIFSEARVKKIPNVFVIVFALILLAAVLTWLLPGGSYQRKEEMVGGQQAHCSG